MVPLCLVRTRHLLPRSVQTPAIPHVGVQQNCEVKRKREDIFCLHCWMNLKSTPSRGDILPAQYQGVRVPQDTPWRKWLQFLGYEHVNRAVLSVSLPRLLSVKLYVSLIKQQRICLLNSTFYCRNIQ